MAKEEIIGGLENAVVRGESIEKAVQSMISAGYSPDEVKEAAGHVNMGTLGRISTPEAQETAQYQKLPSSIIEGKPKSKKKTWMIILIILLVLIIGGIASFMLFGESILSALFPPAA